MNAGFAHVDGLPLDRLEEMIWVGDIPALGAQQCPDRTAILFADRNVQFSYAALEQACNAFVHLVRSLGIKRGDRVAYLGKNSDLYFPALFGAIRAGVVLVPINWRLAAPEIGYQLTDSATRLLICDFDLKTVAEQGIAGANLQLPMIFTEAAAEQASFRDLLKTSAPKFDLPHQHNQIILQLYTSGTTGKPKGVLISHGALSIARLAELRSPDFALLQSACMGLSAMPNFHVGGMSWVLMGLVRFGTMVITADPSAANMLKLIRDYRVEYSWMVPTLIRVLIDGLRAEQQPAPAMKGLFYGAMPMDGGLLKDAMECFGCDFLQFFGMTENTGAATSLGPQDHDPTRPNLLRSVGRPYPGMSIEIRSADQKLLRHGEHGEIWIKSPTCMLGYYNLPAKTEEAIVDGWYATGDGGYLDADGFLFLTDRIKDMIVTGGENVYPVEVEEALRRHPAVLDAGVVGIADARWGEVVVAVIELRPGAEVTEDDLRDHARAHIAGYKCPKAFHFGALPRTASGKVQRTQVRRQLNAAISV
jgi:acyl-CoA synthetase (AMP-forming)/AMP-acid ligase II